MIKNTLGYRSIDKKLVLDLNTFSVKLEPGVTLVANTELLDPNFLMSLVLLCHHDEEGSLGLVLNRPTNLYLDAQTVQLKEEAESEADFPVFWGGPVQPESVFFLFYADREISNSKEVLPGIYLSSHPETLSVYKSIFGLDHSKIRFFMGYSGWSYYQLDCEASSGSWFAQPGKEDYIFHDNSRLVWLSVLKDIGQPFYEAGCEFIEHLESLQSEDDEFSL